MPLSLPHTFASKTVVAGADLDDNFTAIVAKFAAAVKTGDIAASAGILLSQLEASKEHLDVALTVRTGDLAGGWPASGVLAAVPVIGVTGATAWVATDCYWVCQDPGGLTGTFDIEWGAYDAAGTWMTTATVASDTIDSYNDVASLSASTVTLAVGAGPRSLALVATGADATTLAGTAGDLFTAVVRLRRNISSS